MIMSKEDFTKKIEVAIVALKVSTSIISAKFPIYLAEDEVIFLHASKFMYNRDWNVAPYELRTILYRKTENIPTTGAYMEPNGKWQEDKSVIDAWHYSGNSERTAEPRAVIAPVYQVYPRPIPLIRTPTLVTHQTDASTSHVIVLLWYHTEEITDKNLTGLMLKDHA